MDFSSIIDILFIIGAIALGFFPGVKKMLGEEKAPKKVVRPVYRESEKKQEGMRSNQNKKKEQVTPSQPEQENEYFSYETMSERDFEQEFSDNVEENEHFAAVTETPHKDIQLNIDEEEVYKGVVWSEILKRKYE